MDKKQAIDIIDGMINEAKGSASLDSLQQLREKLVAINLSYSQPLRKAIDDVSEVLKKASGVNLTYSQKGQDDMKKVDPKTHLPGVMLDKVATPGMGTSSMDTGSSNMSIAGKANLNPRSDMAKAGGPKSGGAPGSASPLVASEKHKSLTDFMSKCMKCMKTKKSLAAMSEKPAGQEMKKAKDEKGVHNPAFMHGRGSGISDVGARMAPGGAGKATNTWAKEQHKNVLSEQKQMPKPNLPKSENIKKVLGGVGSPGTPVGRPDMGSGAIIVKDEPKMPKPAMPRPAGNPKDPALNTMQHQPKPAAAGFNEKAAAYFKNKQTVQKDDKPHPHGSPEERSHAVAEGQMSLPQAMNSVKDGSGAKSKLLNHLRTLKDKSQLRSPENVAAGMNKAEKMPKPANTKMSSAQHKGGPETPSPTKTKIGGPEYKPQTSEFAANQDKNGKEADAGAKRAITEPADQPIKVGADRPGQANKPSPKGQLDKNEPLTKPYVSEAQRGKFHAMENRGEISHATVKEWDEASKGKKLPAKVSHGKK